jgi:hypothetical protein
VETSASFEARYAPPPYPTTGMNLVAVQVADHFHIQAGVNGSRSCSSEKRDSGRFLANRAGVSRSHP